MGSEVLAVPDEKVMDLILVLERGLRAPGEVDDEVRQALMKWCREHAEHADDPDHAANQELVCGDCDAPGPGIERHLCPFADEIHGAEVELHACGDCLHERAMDI